MSEVKKDTEIITIQNDSSIEGSNNNENKDNLSEDIYLHEYKQSKNINNKDCKINIKIETNNSEIISLNESSSKTVDKKKEKNDQNSEQEINSHISKKSRNSNQYSSQQSNSHMSRNNSANKSNKSAKSRNSNSPNSLQNSPSQNPRRRRRTKEECAGERAYPCPECGKAYLSQPAVNMHRRLKHNFACFGTRGRRPGTRVLGNRVVDEGEKINKDLGEDGAFYDFFNDDLRRSSFDSSKQITFPYITETLTKIFRHFKNTFFPSKNSIQEIKFFNLILRYWNNENEISIYENEKCENENDKNIKKLEIILFRYLRKFSRKTNRQYFSIMLKFVIALRECFFMEIGQEEINTENIPAFFNYLYSTYFEPNNFYGIEIEELCKLSQHFCYWLYLNKYTNSYLKLANN